MDSEALIKIVKQNPILYNKRTKSTIGMKANKWAEIGSKYKVPGGQMQNKWRAIKDRYFLLKRRAEAYPGTVLGQQLQNYKLAKSLSFLDEFIPKYNRLPPKNRIRRSVPFEFSKTWEKSHTILFIKELSSHPLLYDKNHPFYTNTHQRLAAYRKIIAVLKRYRPDLTPDLIAKKIKTIKSQYDREKKELIKRRSKSGVANPPTLWFYNRLGFLDEKRTYDGNNSSVLNSRGTMLKDYEFENKSEEENTGDEDEDFNDEIDEWVPLKESTRPFEEIDLGPLSVEVEKGEFEDKVEEVFDQSEHQETREEEDDGRNYHQKTPEDDRKQKRVDLFIKCTSLLDNLAKQFKPCDSETDDKTKGKCKCENSSPSSMLGKMIESELEKVSEHIYVDAKWKILRILEEAQKRSLREKQDEIP